MLGPWQQVAAKLDVDLAREIALDVQKNMNEYQGLNADHESDILALIEKAHQDIGLKIGVKEYDYENCHHWCRQRHVHHWGGF